MDSLLFFKSLADDTRLKILLLIYKEEELCVCELTQALSLSQPKISRHIALLRRDGLLIDRRDGKWVFYQLSAKLLEWQLTTLSTCLAQNINTNENNKNVAIKNEQTASFKLAECIERLAEMGNRPNRQQMCCN